MEKPKSLTAIVHVKFHYQELEAKPVTEGEVEVISRILDQSSELPVDLQEVVFRFSEYLSKLNNKTNEQSPAS